MTTPAGLVLAAGAGRRFGSVKALVRMGERTLVDRAVTTLRDAGCAPVVVVLGAAAADVVRAADLDDVLVLVNEGWAEGMGSSLRCGLAALTDQAAPAAAVLLVDQPGVTAAAVSRLVDTWRAGAAAAVASYGGQPRNPVVLDAATWPDVCATAVGDVGAREWLRAHPEEVRLVACDDLATSADIDTAADLTQFTEEHP